MADVATRFSVLSDRARNGDLSADDGLVRDEWAAVMLGGIAALPLGDAERDAEMAAIRDAGCSAELAEDIAVQMAAYLGYLRAGRTVASVARMFDRSPATEPDRRLSADERFSHGIEDYARLNPEALDTIRSAFGAIAGDLIDNTFRSFGDVFATSRQPLQLRQLATVSALATVGGVAPQLRFHLGAALRVGVTQEKLVAAITWVQYLAGMPAAYNALIELKAALSDGHDAPPAYR